MLEGAIFTFKAYVSEGLGNIIELILILMPIWLPIMVCIYFWKQWKKYVRANFIASTENVLLEIKLPKEQAKSPKAMESVLLQLFQTGGESTFVDRWFLGKVRAWFSFEIVSIEGKVKFYIWTRKVLRQIVEAAFYSQYPGVEIHEAPDYSLPIKYKKDENVVWGTEYVLTKPDPYPIKTYVDFELDRDPKEEFKVDPMLPILEYFSSAVGPNQQLWIQIIFRAHKPESLLANKLFKTTDKWKDEVKTEIAKIMKTAVFKAEGDDKPNIRNLSPGQVEIVTALERSVTKAPYDVGIRSVIVAKKEFYNSAHIGGLRGFLKQYSSEHLNSFKPSGWLGDFDYAWQDFGGIRQDRVRRHLLNAYKRRSLFHEPYHFKAKGSYLKMVRLKTFIKPPMVLNTEELATIFHLPGEVSKAPGIDRIPSKKGEAPSNLPV